MTTFTSVFGNDAVPPAGQAYVAITLTANTTYFWPELAVGTTLGDINEVTCASNYALTLPDATLVSTGRDLLFRNIGGVAFTLKDSAGGTLSVVNPGEAKYLYLTNNTTAAGLWSILTYGTGTSGADAATLAGHGLIVDGATLSLNHGSVSSIGNYTVQITDRAKTLYFGGSGAVTCSLPSVLTVGDGFFVLLANQGTGSVTVDPASTETIDTQLTKDFAPGESTILVATASGWLTVGYGRSTQFQFTKLVKDISAGSPFTLTSVEAQNKLLQFIGTLSAAATVNVPAIVAIYYVECSFAGAYQLTLKTASGSGVTLNGTDRVIAYCDGVNVVLAQTAFSATNLSLVDGTAANPALGFTLDTNTGFFRAGTDTLGFAGNGTELMRIGTTEALMNVATNWQAGVKAATRSNLGISATNTPNTPAGGISATDVQGALNELDSEKVTGPASATADSLARFDGTTGKLLKNGAVIGVDVQAYDADTAKTDVAQNFTLPQRAALTTDNDANFDLSAKQNFSCTPTGAVTLTFSNQADGLSGSIIFVNGSNYAISAHANTKILATDLTKISATGTYRIDYLSNGTNAYCSVVGPYA